MINTEATIQLLLTDLDDTLYPWMEFYIPAFYAMAGEVAKVLGLPLDEVIAEYHAVHLEKRNIEYPFSTMLLPCVQRAYPDASNEELREIFGEAFHKFNAVRKDKMHLFPHVRETLETLHANGVKIVGYTDSGEANGYYRLQKLGISDLFTEVYAVYSDFERPTGTGYEAPQNVTIVRKSKPNPALLLEICEKYGVDPQRAIFTGDSLTKDVYMAHEAGIRSVWTRHPKSDAYPDYFQQMLAISHWDEADDAREAQIRETIAREKIQADVEVSDYGEVLRIAGYAK